MAYNVLLLPTAPDAHIMDLIAKTENKNEHVKECISKMTYLSLRLVRRESGGQAGMTDVALLMVLLVRQSVKKSE